MPILTILFGLLKDLKVLIIVALIAALGYGYMKFQAVEKKLESTNASLAAEKVNNATLLSNVSVLMKIKENDDRIIEQMRDDKNKSLVSVNKLNGTVSEINKTIAELHDKVVTDLTAPTPLTPAMVEAIKGIQAARELAAITAAATQPAWMDKELHEDQVKK